MKNLVYTFFTALLLLVSVGCKEQQQNDTQHTYRVEYAFTMLSNDSVGNEWEMVVTYNGQSIQSGDTILAPVDADIFIRGEVTEIDAVPDVGSGTVYLKPETHASSVTEITVQENRGVYIGNTATWRLYCSITRIEA